MARRWAVLIDAENVRADVADPLFEHVATWGDACVRRMFGNFDGNHSGWKAAAKRHSIDPFICRIWSRQERCGYSAGNRCHGPDACGSRRFVGSDCDFTSLAGVFRRVHITRLARRLRTAGRTVLGVGRAATAEAFRLACSKFTSVEDQLFAAPSLEAAQWLFQDRYSYFEQLARANGTIWVNLETQIKKLVPQL